MIELTLLFWTVISLLVFLGVLLWLSDNGDTAFSVLVFVIFALVFVFAFNNRPTIRLAANIPENIPER